MPNNPILQALTNELDSSVPPIERVKALTSIAAVLIKKAKLTPQVEEEFVKHMSIATFGDAKEFAEHEECFELLMASAAAIALQELFGGTVVAAAEEVESEQEFAFPEEL